MLAQGPFGPVVKMAVILDELGVPHAPGGSIASSLPGEPRSTVDVDLAVQLDAETDEVLLETSRRDSGVTSPGRPVPDGDPSPWGPAPLTAGRGALACS